jgi:thioredoxin reductase
LPEVDPGADDLSHIFLQQMDVAIGVDLGKLLGSGPTRNAESEHAHNILTRDGTPPAELLRLGHDEVASLPRVTVEEAFVEKVTPIGGGHLRVDLASGTSVDARTVLLATGVRDALPDVPGLDGLWGQRAHSCPFCDGAQYAGRRILGIADETKAGHLQVMLAGWSDTVTILPATAVSALGKVDDHVVADLADGSELAIDGVFVGATPQPRLDCVAHLALSRRGPFLATDREGRTGEPGLWAAGDCQWRDGEPGPGGQVVLAMASASRTAMGIVFEHLGLDLPDPPPVTVLTSAAGA